MIGLHAQQEKRASVLRAAFVATTFLIAFAAVFAPVDAHSKNESSKTVKITLSAAGDCALFNDYETGKSSFDDCFTEHGPAYFLSGVKSVFEKDDVTLVNLEGTFTEAKERAIKTYNFKGSAKYAQILNEGSVEVVNLANNHTMDFKKKGFLDTKKVLRERKVKYCVNTEIAYKTVKGVKMAFVGFNKLDGLTKKQIKRGISRAKKKGAKIIVVSIHWGVEKRYLPTKSQKKLGRYAIDCGASLVLGHHPHVLQGIEKYKGNSIVYSLGNFVFGGNSNPTDKDTMIYQQTFTVKGGKLTKKLDARVIPCWLTRHFFVNTFQPTILEGTEKKCTMSKIRALSAALKTTVSRNGKIR